MFTLIDIIIEYVYIILIVRGHIKLPSVLEHGLETKTEWVQKYDTGQFI